MSSINRDPVAGHIMGMAVLIFFSMVALDFCFALYVLEVAAKHSVKAGLMAAIVQCFNVLIITSYVRDRRFIVPVVLGAFAGTWLVIEIVT